MRVLCNADDKRVPRSFGCIKQAASCYGVITSSQHPNPAYESSPETLSVIASITAHNFEQSLKSEAVVMNLRLEIDSGLRSKR